MGTVSHTGSLMRWKSSSADGCDLVRWLSFLLSRQCSVLGVGSGQEEQKTPFSQTRAREVSPSTTSGDRCLRTEVVDKTACNW